MAKKYQFQSEEEVLLPDGRPTKISYIRHHGAIIVAPLLSSNQILMLRQYRPVIKKYIYELPAGTIDLPEKPLTCVKRELLEETGYSAQRITKIGEIFPVPGYSTEIIHIFKAEQLTRGHAAPEDYEVIEVKTMTRQEVKRLFLQKKLKDAKTICTLLYLGWL